MKKTIVMITLAFVSFTALKCKKKVKEVNFEMPYQTYVWIPQSSIVNIPIPVPGTVATNYLQNFSSHGITREDVKEIKLKYMRYTVVEPDTANFDWLKSIKITASLPGELEEEIASNFNVPVSAKNLELGVTGKDLQRYVTRDSLDMKGVITLDEPMETGVRVKSELLFEVRAEVVD